MEIQLSRKQNVQETLTSVIPNQMMRMTKRLRLRKSKKLKPH